MPVGLPIETALADSGMGGSAPPAIVEIVYGEVESWAVAVASSPKNTRSRVFILKSMFFIFIYSNATVT